MSRSCVRGARYVFCRFFICVFSFFLFFLGGGEELTGLVEREEEGVCLYYLLEESEA